MSPILNSKPPDPLPTGCRPPSIYLLPPEPVQRSHKPVTHGNRASAHIITEFGLQVTEFVYVSVLVSVFNTSPHSLDLIDFPEERES